jgi:hypothetical protein
VDFTLVTTIIAIVIVAMNAEMELLLRWIVLEMESFCRWNCSGDEDGDGTGNSKERRGAQP